MQNWTGFWNRATEIVMKVFIGFAFLASLAFCAVGIYIVFLGEITGLLVLTVFGLAAYAAGPEVIAILRGRAWYYGSANDEQRDAWNAANRDAKKYKKEFESAVEKLIFDHAFEKSAGEMLPPWFMRILPFDLPTSEGRAYWTDGEGGYYWGRFLKFWVPLDLESKKSYFKRYDLGTDWMERDHWYFELFDPTYAIDVTDEAALERLAEDVLGE